MKPSFWKTYSPTLDQPWNVARVKHLHHRLGFSALPSEIERDLRDGPEQSIGRFISADDPKLDPRVEWLVRQSIDSNQIRFLKAAWVMQMWHGRDPLTEQLTLMWHNHFATSFLKVKDCDAMWQQNMLFRRLGRGNFSELLSAMLSDRATLVWLDATTNRAEHPNENLARELLELFTLGVGNYNEQDVQECARALTGWVVDDAGVSFDSANHDHGKKTILGSTENHDAASLAELIVRQPPTALRIAWRICNHFLAAPIPDDALDELAIHLLECELNIESAVKLLVQSRYFFSDAEIQHRVRAPVALVVGGIRSHDLHRQSTEEKAVAPEHAAGWMAAMGQDLFQPPSVAGWQGGGTWISTSAMIQRAAFAEALSEGALHGNGRRLDARELATANAQLD